MANPTTLRAIKTIPFFADLTEEEYEELANGLELRHIKKGERILRANEPAHFMMFSVFGRLNVIHENDEGKEVIIATVPKGGVFGDLALLTGRVRSASVDAAEDGAILVLSRDQLENLILSSQRLTQALVKDLAQRLYDTSKQAAKLVLLRVYNRLAHILVSLGKTVETEEGICYVIENCPTHRELAAMAGTGRSDASRAMKELENNGHIKVEGRKVTVLSLPD